MKSPTDSPQQISLELTEEQSRQIERATGRFVTSLQIEVVEVTEPPDEPLTRNKHHSIKEGETP